MSLACGAAAVSAQNGTPSQQDNPFPGETQKPANGQTGQTDKPAAQKPKPESDNPFPGEDSNAPIIPVEPNAGAGTRPAPRPPTSAATDGGRAETDPDGDPVRSPDLPGAQADDGFSSSRSGVTAPPAEDDTQAVPGQSGKRKSREEKIKDDIDTGGFYAEKKNWKAAQSRYADAFALDKENADALWGLAEAERHLQMTPQAREHYQLFLSYDPDGPHSRAARKALEQLEAQAAQPSSKPADPQGSAPK